MLLCIDVGNSNIVGGLFEGKCLADSFRIRTVHAKTEDEYGVSLRSILEDRGLKPDAVDRVILSSVVPALTRTMEELCRRLFGISPITLGPAFYPRLPVRISAPEEIGTDLVADAVAAYSRVRGPCIVVDFGTALTFTCVAADGEIAGVAIAPGLGTAMNSLSRETAQLPNVPLQAPPSALGRNTVHSMQAGVVFGFAGLVESLVGRMKKELGGRARVIATGGLSGIIAPLAACIDETDQDLTLSGLAEIAGILG